MRTCVLGANGFIGKNLIRRTEWVGITRQQLDLTNQKDVDSFFESNTFDVIIHCAVIGGSRLAQDSGDVCYKNLLMFENVVRHSNKFKKMIYFSSGASKRGDPPTDPYGFSKWIIDQRIKYLPNVYSMCIWGCYGPDELPTRFSAICKREGFVTIQKDRYFDFIDVEDVVIKVISHTYEKFTNLVYPEKKKLSEWATYFGAKFHILEEGLDESYCHDTLIEFNINN
jgi:nucleoside-diphosphate-sugar epimerase